MPADKTITIRFLTKGDPELLSAFKGLAAGQNKLNKATGKSDKKLKEYGRTQQRVTKSTGLLGNAFSVIRSKMLLFSFAVSMGTKQIVGFAQEAAKLDSVNRGFTSLIGGVQNATSGLRKLKDATNGTMSEMDLFTQANNAMILGVSKNSDEMAEMFDMAQRLGRALGRDTKSSVESLITGIGRQSRLMLDNIGIIVKAEEAYKNYAKILQKSVDKLTNAEKRQAFLTEALRAGKEAISQLGDEQLTAQDKFDKFNSTLKDFTSFLGSKASPVVLAFLSGTAEFLRQITETGLETAVRHLKDMGVSLNEIQDLEKALNIEKASNALTGANDKITSLFQNNIKNSNMSDRQLTKLGATVENITTGTHKQGMHFRRNVKLLDAQGISSKVVSKEMAKITEENAKYASELVEVANKDKDRAESLRVKIGWNTREFEWLAKILQLTKDRTNAEKLLKSIQSGEDASSTGASDEELKGIVELTKFNDDLVKAKGFLLAVESKTYKRTKEGIELNNITIKGIKEKARIDAQIVSLIRQKADATDAEKKVIEEIIPILEQVKSKGLEGRDVDRDAVTAKYLLIDALKLEKTQKLMLTAMSDGELTFNEEKAISEQKILELQIALNLEGANTLSINKQIFAEKNKLIGLEAVEQRMQSDKIKLAGKGIQVGANILALNSKNAKEVAQLQALATGVNAFAAASDSFAQAAKNPLTIANPMYPNIVYGLTLAQGLAASASAFQAANKMEQGGLVGGRRHSAGGTMIEAERGEFVMSRNAVDSIGLEAMNRINAGGGGGAVSINFTGNVMSQDFIEDEAIPMIKEAIRRGADIGVA